MINQLLANEDRGVTVIRLAAAVLMGIHGVARIALGIVGAFGTALGQWGFPLGGTLAWSITIFEIIGALALLTNRFVVPVAMLFIAQLLMGIALIHAKSGWFVVGAGRNGVEFSVLLIACFAALIVSRLARR